MWLWKDFDWNRGHSSGFHSIGKQIDIKFGQLGSMEADEGQNFVKTARNVLHKADEGQIAEKTARNVLHEVDEGQIAEKIAGNVLHEANEGQIAEKITRNVLHKTHYVLDDAL